MFSHLESRNAEMHPRSLRAAQAVVATIDRGFGAATTVRCTMRDFIDFRFKPLCTASQADPRIVRGVLKSVKLRYMPRINLTQIVVDC